jgi:hypothetical protein
MEYIEPKELEVRWSDVLAVRTGSRTDPCTIESLILEIFPNRSFSVDREDGGISRITINCHVDVDGEYRGYELTWRDDFTVRHCTVDRRWVDDRPVVYSRDWEF